MSASRRCSIGYRFCKGFRLGIDKAVAGGIVGAYGGSVYLSTIFGA